MAKLGLYEPLNRLKPVGDEIWIVDGPPVRFYGMGFPTRMTVIRVNGGLFLHSPIALDHELLAQLADLGPVRWLIAPNTIHYVSVAEWSKRFPEAVVWAAPGVAARARKFNIPFPPHHVLDDEAADGYASDIRQRVVRGHRFLHEVVFFHTGSKTLILTDLIENFEAPKVGKVKAFLFRMTGILDPDGKAPADMRATFRSRVEARETMREVTSWAPERVILSHGRWYECNGVAELRRAFRWLNL